MTRDNFIELAKILAIAIIAIAAGIIIIVPVASIALRIGTMILGKCG